MGTLYRVFENLTFDSGKKIPMDSISPLKGISHTIIAILLSKGRIAEVKSPPLAILPGWGDRAELLESVGIVTVSQLVTADIDEVARQLGVSAKGLRQSAEEALSWIQHK